MQRCSAEGPSELFPKGRTGRGRQQEGDESRSCDSHLGDLLRHDPRQPLAGNLSVHPRKLLRLCLLQDRLAEAHDAGALRQQHGLGTVLQASGVQGFGSRRESYGHNPDWDLCDHIHCKRRCFVPGCQIFVKDQPEIRAGQL